MGKIGEQLLKRFLIKQGYQVNPITPWNAKDEKKKYTIEQRIERANKTVFSPDMLVCIDKEHAFFADAKLKGYKNCNGWINKRDYDKYFHVIRSTSFIGFRIYFIIKETHEIYVLNKLIDPKDFPITQQSDGEVYVIPAENLVKIGDYPKPRTTKA